MEGKEEYVKDGSHKKLYRDNIHSDIFLDDFITLIIDTPEFQRLDKIKQLGMCNLVYRCAKHTRFLHSIGVYHLSKKILDFVVQNHQRLDIPVPVKKISNIYLEGHPNDEDDIMEFKRKIEGIKKVVSVAALLHDITHVPFGHTLEDGFKGIYTKHDSLENLRLYYLLFPHKSDTKEYESEISRVFAEYPNEYVGGLPNQDLKELVFLILKYKVEVKEDTIIDFDKLIAKEKERIEKEEATDDVKDMLTKLSDIYEKFKESGLFHPFMSDVISDTICADILDYIPRDALNCGLILDWDPRIFQYFIIGEDTLLKQLRLAITISTNKGEKWDIADEILKIMELRYNLADRVYYHKAKVAPTCMIVRALERTEPPPPDESPINKESIINLTESDLFSYIRERAGDDKITKFLIENVGEGEFSSGSRNIYKPILILPYHLVGKWGGVYQKLLEFRNLDNARENRERIQNELSQLINDQKEEGEKEDLVLVYCPPEHMQAKLIETPVKIKGDIMPLRLHQSNLPYLFKDSIELLEEKYKGLWKFYVLIHPDYIPSLLDSPDKRRKKLLSIGIVIKEFCEKNNIPIEDINDCCPYRFLTPESAIDELFDRWAQNLGENLDYQAQETIKTLLKTQWRTLGGEKPIDIFEEDKFSSVCYRLFDEELLSPKLEEVGKGLRDYIKTDIKRHPKEVAIRLTTPQHPTRMNISDGITEYLEEVKRRFQREPTLDEYKKDKEEEA